MLLFQQPLPTLIVIIEIAGIACDDFTLSGHDGFATVVTDEDGHLNLDALREIASLK